MTMTAEQSRQTGGYYANQWTVRDEYAARAMDLAAYGRCLVRDLSDWRLRSVAGRNRANTLGMIADAMLAERRRGSGKGLAERHRRSAEPAEAGLHRRTWRRRAALRRTIARRRNPRRPWGQARARASLCVLRHLRRTQYRMPPDYDPPDAINPYAKPYDDALAAQARLRRHLPAHEGEL